MNRDIFSFSVERRWFGWKVIISFTAGVLCELSNLPLAFSFQDFPYALKR